MTALAYQSPKDKTLEEQLPGVPPEVLALAERCGAKADTAAGEIVSLGQTGFMRQDAQHAWAPFRATQTITLDRPGFAWRASTGPFGLIHVTDALDDAGPQLRITALSAVPLVRVVPDNALMKGELQRYLAELPFAPDAILRNMALEWTVIGPTALRVAATHHGVRAQVDLTLGGHGLVVSAFAPDRPRLEGSVSVERPWTGHFGDYRLHQGRRLPFAAEVAWTLDGKDVTYWRCDMTHWGLA